MQDFGSPNSVDHHCPFRSDIYYERALAESRVRQGFRVGMVIGSTYLSTLPPVIILQTSFVGISSQIVRFRSGFWSERKGLRL